MTKEELKTELDKIDRNIFWEIDGAGNVEPILHVVNSNRLEPIVMLQSKVKELLECDVKNNIFDDYASDGDGRFDMWKTSRLIDIMSDLRKMVYLST
ncbi:MAG: hypothetical protein ABIJ40_04120 [Bacteroidota bacterium]